MGRRIRKGSLQYRIIERRMQDFFADAQNARIDPETGVMHVKGVDTFQRAADYVSGRTEKTGTEIFEEWDREDTQDG